MIRSVRLSFIMTLFSVVIPYQAQAMMTRGVLAAQKPLQPKVSQLLISQRQFSSESAKEKVENAMMDGIMGLCGGFGGMIFGVGVSGGINLVTHAVVENGLYRNNRERGEESMARIAPYLESVRLLTGLGAGAVGAYGLSKGVRGVVAYAAALAFFSGGHISIPREHRHR